MHMWIYIYQFVVCERLKNRNDENHVECGALCVSQEQNDNYDKNQAGELQQVSV